MFRNKRRAQERKNWSQTSTKDLNYATRLSFYRVPPNLGISLSSFEEWAIDRLKVLTKIQQAQQSGKMNIKEFEAVIKPALEQFMPLSSNNALRTKSKETIDQERQKDHYSHFILRLVYCRTPDLRKVFVERERLLFRYRLSCEDAADRDAFIQSLEFDWEVVSESELASIRPFLDSTTNNSRETFVKVDWQRVTDLVDARRVFLKGGKAYVPSSLQQNLVVSEFTSRLNQALDASALLLSRMDEATRLTPILDHLATFGVTETFASAEALDGRVGPSNIDENVKHMPLCMSQLHQRLRQKNHLKHDGRFQYGLFIKGLGFSVDEALQFWRDAFKTTDDKFNKEYQYNILHNYGLKGSGKNYAPKDCKSIIANNPPSNSADLVHGCPYRSMKPEALINKLRHMGIEDRQELNRIEDQVKNTNYHGACSRVLELTHPGVKVGDEVIQHPNDYFLKAFSHSAKAAVEYTS